MCKCGRSPQAATIRGPAHGPIDARDRDDDATMSSDHPSQIPDKPRLVRRPPRDAAEAADTSAARDPLASRPAQWLRTVLEYVGLAKRKQLPPVVDTEGLAHFLDTRASYVAQMSLYGYLRTRAGMRYPELFDDDPFVAAINVAKWHCWLDCLGDLAEYAGGMLARDGGAPPAQAGALVVRVVDGILARTGQPADGGGDFLAHAGEVRARLAACDWAVFEDGEAAFHASPAAVVRYAPVVDQLKQLDESIVRNSVRFRWQEVRRDLRQCLDAAAVLRSAGD